MKGNSALVFCEEQKSVAGSRWPWDWQTEELTDAVMAEIMRNLPSYALDSLGKEPEDVGMTDYSLWAGFQTYCQAVKQHFEKTAKEAPYFAQERPSEIAEEALGVVDRLLEYVNEHLNASGGMKCTPADYSYVFADLWSQWDAVVRKPNL